MYSTVLRSLSTFKGAARERGRERSKDSGLIFFPPPEATFPGVTWKVKGKSSHVAVKHRSIPNA